MADRWRVGRLVGEPEAGAVLLLSELPDREAWEVAYLGLTPAARGRGLGRGHAGPGHCHGGGVRPRIELAVDVRNRPATQLYVAAEFVPFDRRAVHLASPNPPSRRLRRGASSWVKGTGPCVFSGRRVGSPNRDRGGSADFGSAWDSVSELWNALANSWRSPRAELPWSSGGEMMAGLLVTSAG